MNKYNKKPFTIPKPSTTNHSSKQSKEMGNIVKKSGCGCGKKKRR